MSGSDVIHVVPVGDLREHVERGQCWCCPRIEGEVIIHNSMDRRETHENGRPLQ